MTHIITIKKSVHENSPKMSTRIHQNNVHEKSPQKRNSSGQKCPREFVKSVHENSPILSTRIHLLCPLEFFHPLLARRARENYAKTGEGGEIHEKQDGKSIFYVVC